MDIKRYRELHVGQKARVLKWMVFKITDSFPRADLRGIVSQVRRSSSSVAANIAVGFGRGLSRDLHKISHEEFARIDVECDSVARLVNALARSLRARLARHTPSPVTSHPSRPS